MVTKLKLKWIIKMFKSKEEEAIWVLDQLTKYGIRQPTSFTEHLNNSSFKITDTTELQDQGFKK